MTQSESYRASAALGACPAGTPVAGTYCGVPFRGTLRGVRRHTINHLAWEFTVELAEPIMLHGHVREGRVLAYAAFSGDRLPLNVWSSSEAIRAQVAS